MEVDKSYANDISILIQNYKNSVNDELEVANLLAAHRKMQFDCYKSAGFTDEQSLSLVEAEIRG